MELEILHGLAEMRDGGIIDSIMLFITKLGDAGIFWIILAIALLCFKKYRKAGATMSVALIFSLIYCNLILKNLVARERPFDADTTLIPLVDAHDFSFPSGHTSASFAAAISLFVCHKKEGIAALILAALIAFSRMYVGVHYPTDILGGIVTGSLAAITSVIIVYMVVKKYEISKISE